MFIDSDDIVTAEGGRGTRPEEIGVMYQSGALFGSILLSKRAPPLGEYTTLPLRRWT